MPHDLKKKEPCIASRYFHWGRRAQSGRFPERPLVEWTL